MKVLIINPPVEQNSKYIREGRCEQRASSFQYLMVPISLPSIAGLLRSNGFEVKILDSVAEDFDNNQTIKYVKKFQPKLIIVNISTATFNGDKVFVELLKKNVNAHLSAIGVHVTSLHSDLIMETNLDSIIRGEPEETALELARSLDNKKNLKFVKGLTYKSKLSFVINPSRPFISDLDTLPFPARDLLKNELYKMPVYNRPYTLVIASRGCPNNCSFCTASLYYGSRVRFRSPENVLDEVEEILKVQKIPDITFWADTFTFNRAFVLKICDGIKKRGLHFRWMCNSRVDRVDLEMLRKMKEAGCQIISFGVESGSQKILDNVGKNINPQLAQRAFRLVRQAGIESAAHFIFGLPGETEETIRESLRLVKKINPDYAQFYSAIPFPGTRFYKEAKKKCWIVTDNWSDFELGKNIVSTDKLTVDDLAKWRKKAYMQFYLRPAYIWNKLKKFVRKPSDLWLFTKESVSFAKDWIK